MENKAKKKCIKLIILFIAVILIVILILQCKSVLDKAYEDKPPKERVYAGFSDGEIAAFETFRGWVQSISQITIILFGAIWGFVLSQKVVFITTKNLCLWIAFLVPNTCFICEQILYTKALGRFIEMLFKLNMVTMEKGTDYFYLLPNTQLNFFFFGIFASIVYIILVLLFKKGNMVDLYNNRTSAEEK